MNNIDELIYIMKENPDLPVIPMVDHEVVGDDCGLWAGSWGRYDIDYIFEPPTGCGIWFKSDEDYVEWFEELYDYEEEGITENTSDEEADQIIEEKINALPWKKVIIVYINTYDYNDGWVYE